jgi:hypothetical protein
MLFNDVLPIFLDFHIQIMGLCHGLTREGSANHFNLGVRRVNAKTPLSSGVFYWAIGASRFLRYLAHRYAAGQRFTAIEGKPSSMVGRASAACLRRIAAQLPQTRLDFRPPAANTEFILCTDKVTKTYKSPQNRRQTWNPTLQ